MLRSTGCLLIILWSALYAKAQDESFRFFLDTKGADEEAVRPAGPLLFTNPTVVNSGRLYLYVEYGDAAQSFFSTNLVIDITGPGVITGGNYYDHDIPDAASGNRWRGNISNKVRGDGINDSLDLPTRWWIGQALSWATSSLGFGANNAPNPNAPDHPHPAITDSHFSGFVGGDDSPFGTTLLGYIDVASTGPGVAEIRLQNGTAGNAGWGISNSDRVYFGYGDASSRNRRGALTHPSDPGGPTPIPEAYIVPVPEPASVCLFVICAAALRRRRN